MEDKGLIDYSRDWVLAIAMGIASIVTWIIKRQAKSESIQATQSTKLAEFAMTMTERTSAMLEKEIAALRQRVTDLEKTVREMALETAALQRKWADERVEKQRLASENEDLRAENEELRNSLMQ